MIMRMQLDITLKYSIMNVLIIKKRIYLNARERYNIIQKDDGDDGDDWDDASSQIVLIVLVVLFVLGIVSLLDPRSGRNKEDQLFRRHIMHPGLPIRS